MAGLDPKIYKSLEMKKMFAYACFGPTMGDVVMDRHSVCLSKGCVKACIFEPSDNIETTKYDECTKSVKDIEAALVPYREVMAMKDGGGCGGGCGGCGDDCPDND